jgi:hypothetical protein
VSFTPYRERYGCKFADLSSILEFFLSSTKRHDSHELRLHLFILFIYTTMLEARGLKGESFGIPK